MSQSQQDRTARHRARSTFLAVLVVTAAIMGVLFCRSSAQSSSEAVPSISDPSAHLSQEHLRGDVPDGRPGHPQGEHHRGLGVADGEVPTGVTVFDSGYPAVAKLDPALLAALRKAGADAGDDGVELYVNSGWRAPAFQQQLLDEAVSKYGSRAQAARWVATPTTSPHVSGDAVDIGDSDATRWLSEHGAEYGLCQIYSNEPWHYELRPDTVDHGCPSLFADPTHDPRMH